MMSSLDAESSPSETRGTSAESPLRGMPSPLSTPDTGGNGHKKVGPIIATLVIVIILIIAALYVFASHVNQQAIPTDNSTAQTDNANNTAPAPSSTSTVQAVTNTSTDVQSLQNDLNASTQGVDSQNF